MPVVNPFNPKDSTAFPPIGGPCKGMIAATPSDTVNETFGFVAMRVASGGSLSFLDYNDNIVVLPEVVTGEVILCGCKRVNQTGTTATVHGYVY
jgi:hypothetical protein